MTKSSEPRNDRTAREVDASQDEEIWRVVDPAIELPTFEPQAPPSTIELPRLSAQKTLVEPDVIALPSFDAPRSDASFSENEVNPSSRSEESSRAESDALPNLSFRNFVVKKKELFFAAAAETILCPPCGVYAWRYLFRSFKAVACEDYVDAEQYESKAYRALKFGKRITLVAFISVAAVLVCATLRNP
ncbi:MAG: hypothetical protein ACOX0A_08680 [Thermoguttaceae bacterium]|jgi:hypothetical protein